MDSFVFARHTPDCRFKRERLYRRCNCPKWVEGRFNRERIRKSAAKVVLIEFESPIDPETGLTGSESASKPTVLNELFLESEDLR